MENNQTKSEPMIWKLKEKKENNGFFDKLEEYEINCAKCKFSDGKGYSVTTNLCSEDCPIAFLKSDAEQRINEKVEQLKKEVSVMPFKPKEKIRIYKIIDEVFPVEKRSVKK